MYTFLEFHKRICDGHYSDDELWRKVIGYRPDDRDGGFRRWLEITGNKMEDFLNEFRAAAYRDSAPKAPPKISVPMQLEWKM